MEAQPSADNDRMDLRPFDDSWECLDIRSETKNLRTVRAFVMEVLARHGLSHSERNKLVLAVDEVIANVMEHGYGGDESGEIGVAVRLQGGRVEVAVRDNGRSFDPTTVPEPNLLEHIRQGRNRGLGLYLIRRIMDEVHYRTYDGSNELRMSRALNDEGKAAPG